MINVHLHSSSTNLKLQCLFNLYFPISNFLLTKQHLELFGSLVAFIKLIFIRSQWPQSMGMQTPPNQLEFKLFVTLSGYSINNWKNGRLRATLLVHIHIRVYLLAISTNEGTTVVFILSFKCSIKGTKVYLVLKTITILWLPLAKSFVMNMNVTLYHKW